MTTAGAVNTVVIGAGQAGLAMSRWLSLSGVSHVVLERGRVGNSWRTQRWASFCLNTPNVINTLPGDRYLGDDPWGFGTRDELLAYLDDFGRRHDLPIVEGVEVTAVRSVGDGFEVEAGGELRRCRNVVLCSGDQNDPQTPALAAQLPADIEQMHAADYRRPNLLPEGAVLVVGGGQSGVQIVEDLLEAGRTVYLCTSAVGSIPRRYRGQDILAWFQEIGLSDQRPQDLEHPDDIYNKQPLTSGTHGGHTVSLPQLARAGATLLGRLDGVEARTLRIAGDLEANVAAGEALSTMLAGAVDRYIAESGTDAPPAEADPLHAPFDGIAEMAAVRELDLDDAGIRSVVFTTGFGPDFGYLDPDLLDERGRPRHLDGVCEEPGLYCVGMLWLRRRVSGLLTGVDADAEFIAGRIVERNTTGR
jgi:putative flavoprotein involved in K+ transport